MPKDYYQILGLDRSASDEEIKKAYKKLAKQYHPDLNKEPGAENKFKEINEAFQILGDSQKKHNYDNYNITDDMQGGGFNGGAGPGFDPYDIFNSFFNQQNFGDFSSPFGGQRKRASQENKVQCQIMISFISSVTGCQYKLNYKSNVICTDCKGNKTYQGEHKYKTTCSTCKGAGVEYFRAQTPFGTVNSQKTCDSCGGLGEQITKSCTTCRARGYVNVDKTVDIKIPPGIQNGEKLVFKDNTAYKKLQVFIEVFVQKSKVFERQGWDLYTEVYINPLTIILGGNIQVPTPLGIKTIKINEFVNCSDFVKLKGYGVSASGGMPAGNLYIKLRTCKLKLSKADLNLLKSIKIDEPKEIKDLIDKAKKEIDQK